MGAIRRNMDCNYTQKTTSFPKKVNTNCKFLHNYYYLCT